MKRLMLLSLIAVAGCAEMPAGGLAEGLGGTGGGSAYREYLVLGSSMSFEDCRSRGGLIIRDQGSPMVACDPAVQREPVPADEFDHPGAPVSSAAAGEAEADQA